MSAEDEQSDQGPTGAPLVIDTTPLCFWDYDHANTQLQLLNNIDPFYFDYLCRMHEEHLSGEDNLYAAVGLRITYSHALESLFALIGAAVQAPECPAGWLLKYKNSELTRLIEKISKRENFYNKLHIERGNWREIANRLHDWNLAEDLAEEMRAAIVEETKSAAAKLWSTLAREYIDRDFQEEYNSLKHGLRVISSPWSLAFGREDVRGVRAPAERMQVMAQSAYGSSFLRAANLKPHHWQFETQRVNWHPATFVKRLPLVVISINNVLVFLKITNHTPAENVTFIPLQQQMVDEALSTADRSASTKWSLNRHVSPETIPDISREAILSHYQNDSNEGV